MATVSVGNTVYTVRSWRSVAGRLWKVEWRDAHRGMCSYGPCDSADEAMLQVLGERFTSLDGITAAPPAWRVAWLRESGYVQTIPARGTLGSSELCMHTRTDGMGVVAVLVRPENPHYAYAVLADGSLLDGIYHRFDDGTISIS